MEPHAFAFQLYVDDYEPLNALKGQKGRKKITTVYWRLLNLDPRRQAKTCNIQIASICLSSVTAHARLVKVIGGDPSDATCTSFCGSMRRFAQGVQLHLPGQEP